MRHVMVCSVPSSSGAAPKVACRAEQRGQLQRTVAWGRRKRGRLRKATDSAAPRTTAVFVRYTAHAAPSTRVPPWLARLAPRCARCAPVPRAATCSQRAHSPSSSTAVLAICATAAAPIGRQAATLAALRAAKTAAKTAAVAVRVVRVVRGPPRTGGTKRCDHARAQDATATTVTLTSRPNGSSSAAAAIKKATRRLLQRPPPPPAILGDRLGVDGKHCIRCHLRRKAGTVLVAALRAAVTVGTAARATVAAGHLLETARSS